jgi:hypothetical protein
MIVKVHGPRTVSDGGSGPDGGSARDCGVLIGQAGEFVGDDLGAGQVDVASGQGGTGGGQAMQGGREVQEAVGGAASQG